MFKEHNFEMFPIFPCSESQLVGTLSMLAVSCWSNFWSWIILLLISHFWMQFRESLIYLFHSESWIVFIYSIFLKYDVYIEVSLWQYRLSIFQTNKTRRNGMSCFPPQVIEKCESHLQHGLGIYFTVLYMILFSPIAI